MNGYSIISQMLLQKYLELVNDLYSEPKNEEILHSVLVPCVESELKQTTNCTRFKKKGKNNKAKKQPHVGS